MLPSHHWYGIVPGWLIFAAMVAVAVVLFARRVTFLVRLLLKGKPASRWDHLPARIGKVLVYVIGQARLIGGDFWPGLMHATIFWGFIILTLGTIEFFGKGVTESFFLPFMSDTGGFLVLQDLFSVLVIAAVSYAAFRRIVTRPRRLTLSAEGLVILSLIFGLMVSDLVADAGRIVLAPAPSDHWQFAGHALAGALAGLPHGAVAAIFHAAWWLHAALLLGFLVWLPYSKHLHVLAAPLNVFFATLEPKGRFRTVDLENAETFGVGEITEFTWKDLFDTYNCTECGRCTSRCPANMSGKELDPKMLILHLQEPSWKRGPPSSPEPKNGAPAGAATAHGGALVGDVIHDNVLWACTMCRWCVDACPVFIEHVPKITDMRALPRPHPSRASPRSCSRPSATWRRNGNPWQMSWQTRADWADDLGVRVDERRRARPSISTGSAATAPSTSATRRSPAPSSSSCRRPRSISRSSATRSSCTGDPARRLGNEYLYQTLAQGNVETLKHYRFKTIVTACPHCFNTIKNEYPDFGGHFRVIHHSQLLDDLVGSGRLRVAARSDGPHHLPRRLQPRPLQRRVRRAAARPGLVDAGTDRRDGAVAIPRVLLRRRRRSGADGGARGAAREPGARRAGDGGESGHPRLGCPFCLTMFEDGVKAKEVGDRIKTRDIAEVLVERLAVTGS